MPQQQAPFLEGKYGWNFGESGWDTGMNENLLKFSFMFDGNVDSIVASLPPVSNGAAHFNSIDNRFYFGVDTVWYSSPCPKSFIFKIKSNGDFYQFNGTSAVKIDNPSETNSRLSAVELTVSSLGTAAFQNVEDFATQVELDVVEGQAQGYTDALKDDLANPTDPAKGAGLVGYNGGTTAAALQILTAATNANTAEQYGAVGDGVADDYAALAAAVAANTAVRLLPGKTYRITQKLTIPGGKYLISDSATILKDFAGVGVEFVGGSSFNYVSGTLYVTASAAHTADTSADSLAPTEHGVHIINNRLIVDGTIISTGHKGSGVKFDSTAPNSNRSIMNLRGRSNGVHGVHFSGTHDDCAAWQVDLFADGNRKSGVRCDDDFVGRVWKGFIYTEANCKDGASAGCYLGKLRASELFIYSEEQAVGAREISLGANSEYMRITSLRGAVDEDFSAASKRNVWVAGQKTYTPGYPGGPRTGVAGSFHAVRARTNQPTEYVDVPLLVGNEELVGSLRGWGGATSPSVGVASADGFSRIEVANGEARITIAGTLRLLVGAGFVRTPSTTVASLPAAATAGAGARAFVTDANATTFASVVAAGGSNGVPVYSDGTNWRIG